MDDLLECTTNTSLVIKDKVSSRQQNQNLPATMTDCLTDAARSSSLRTKHKATDRLPDLMFLLD